MAIIDDYGAIAKRMRELRGSAPKDAKQITDLEQWREAALSTARAYIQQRRMEIARNQVLRRLPQPTD